MANKRIKKKLTSKQVNRISLVISTIYFICMFVNGIISKTTGDEAAVYWMMGCVTGPLLVYVIFYFVIFQGDLRGIEEKEKYLEFVTAQSLSHTDFKKVYFLLEGSGGTIDMMKEILQKEGCKFYAKLTENDNIYMIVKDKHNEEVYSSEIENYTYFNSNFRIEE